MLILRKCNPPLKRKITCKMRPNRGIIDRLIFINSKEATLGFSIIWTNLSPALRGEI